MIDYITLSNFVISGLDKKKEDLEKKYNNYIKSYIRISIIGFIFIYILTFFVIRSPFEMITFFIFLSVAMLPVLYICYMLLTVTKENYIKDINEIEYIKQIELTSIKYNFDCDKVKLVYNNEYESSLIYKLKLGNYETSIIDYETNTLKLNVV